MSMTVTALCCVHVDAGEPVLLLGHPQSLSRQDLVASMTAGVSTLRYVNNTLALVQSDALSGCAVLALSQTHTHVVLFWS